MELGCFHLFHRRTFAGLLRVGKVCKDRLNACRGIRDLCAWSTRLGCIVQNQYRVSRQKRIVCMSIKCIPCDMRGGGLSSISMSPWPPARRRDSICDRRRDRARLGGMAALGARDGALCGVARGDGSPGIKLGVRNFAALRKSGRIVSAIRPTLGTRHGHLQATRLRCRLQP